MITSTRQVIGTQKLEKLDTNCNVHKQETTQMIVMSILSLNLQTIYAFSKPQVLSKLLDQIGQSSDNSILDAGCGEGEWLNGLPFKEAVGLDVCKASLMKAKATNQTCHYVLGSVTALPFQDGTFNLTVCNVVLPYVNQKQTINELNKATTNNGLIYLSLHGFGYYLAHAFEQCNIHTWGNLGLSILLYLLGTRIGCKLQKRNYTTIGSMQTVSRFTKMLRKTPLHTLKIKVATYMKQVSAFYFLCRKVEVER